MGVSVMQLEGCLRFFSVILAIITACVLGFNIETETFVIERKATVKSIHSVWIVTVVACAVAGYHFIQCCKCFIRNGFCKIGSGTNKWEAWLCLALDQVAMYILLGTTATATQGSLIAVTGEDGFQWMKLCNVYTRFCVEVAGGIVTAVLASLAMTLVSIVSAHQLFVHYRPHSSKSDKAAPKSTSYGC